MISGECPTVGCANTQGGGAAYDHLGMFRAWCAVHVHELIGVRKRITALLAQIEGLRAVLSQAKMNVTDENVQIAGDLQRTLLEQGVLLVRLIRRERELTGAGVKGV